MSAPYALDRGGAVPRAFTKMSGAGNDFLVFGSRVGVGPTEAETIRRLCRRGTGVGADGVLFLSASSPDRVMVAYYNADGGAARFCANGTRCAARFAALRLGLPSVLDVETGWGVVGATVRADGSVTLRLPAPVGPAVPVPTFDPNEKVLERSGAAVSAGVPHLVIFTSGPTPVEALDLEALAPPLRFHPALPEGANVHFVEVVARSKLNVRSWERGVEGETLSCGSGAVATAVVAALSRRADPPVAIRTRSGEELVVDFTLGESAATDVTLTGDARFIFEGTWNEEIL